MYQQITLIGNLGRDPEMRYTPTGVAVTSFTLAVNRRWTGQDGQQQDKTTWFRVTAWRKLAETASQYLTKGSKVLVIGTVEEPQAYIDREGQPRASLEVTAQDIRFLSTRGEGMESHSGHTGAAAAEGGPAMSDEDIPF
ncbi:MAG TPA: single-stranded DNA-binding protein [Chloroflexi bacterium]|nr:single-stranded DNA-binding protein [Chloroflexota bacterium]HHW84672.1 single-stranded DNA-binding protein [Chloroflexota bacterium]